MAFRILTVVLIIVSGIFFLTDTQRFHNKDRVEHFNDEILLDLLGKRREALANFDLDNLRPMYSKNIVNEVVTPDGITHRSGYRELMELLEDFNRTGRNHEKTPLNHVIMVAEDGLTATVRKEAIESWTFEGEFQSVSSHLVETQHWVLENGIPKIAEIRKEHSISDPFFLQRREKRLISGS